MFDYFLTDLDNVSKAEFCYFSKVSFDKIFVPIVTIFVTSFGKPVVPKFRKLVTISTNYALCDFNPYVRINFRFIVMLIDMVIQPS